MHSGPDSLQVISQPMAETTGRCSRKCGELCGGPPIVRSAFKGFFRR